MLKKIAVIAAIALIIGGISIGDLGIGLKNVCSYVSAEHDGSGLSN